MRLLYFPFLLPKSVRSLSVLARGMLLDLQALGGIQHAQHPWASSFWR